MSAVVSIIIRTQNRIQLLKRAVKSVYDQTYPHKELIIVNDGGSRSEIESAVGEIEKEKTLFVHNETVKGRGIAGNQALKYASGDFIAFLDDDDTWDSEFLQKTVNFLIKFPSYGGVITHVNRVEEKMQKGEPRIIKIKPFEHAPKTVSLIELAEKNFIPMHSIVFSKEIGKHLGLFDETLDVLEDWDLFLRIASEYEIGVIPERLANYHIRTASDDPAYVNTVTASKEKCLYYETYLRNKYLRKDLEKGDFGLGILMNLSYGLRDVSLWRCLKKDIKLLFSNLQLFRRS